MVKFLVGLALALGLFVGLGTPLLAQFAINQYALPPLTLQARKLTELTPRILDDLRLLEAYPPFAESDFQRDAAPVFDHYVPFEGARTQADIPGVNALEQLFSRYPYWMTAPGERRKLLADDLGRELSTEWLEMVHKYDHWNVTGREPSVVKPNESQIPNYSVLRAWALLHVLRRQRDGAVVAGLQTLRQVAFLAHTSGNLVGHIAAALLLRDERTLVEMFRVPNWTPIDEKIVTAYERIAFAWIGIWPGVFLNGLPSELEPYVKPQFGVCPASWEFTPVQAAVENYFRPHFPGEPDFRPNFRRMEELQKKLLRICHQAPHPDLLMPRAPITDIPFVRRFIGIRHFALAGAKLSGYELKLK